MTIKQVFVEDGVDRPHPPAKIIRAFKAGFEAGVSHEDGYDDSILNKAFYEWWEEHGG